MRAFHAFSNTRILVCPICEAGKLGSFGGNSVRCDSCGCLLNMAVAETLEEIVRLPDALGSHACECGHPEMRLLPDGVYCCPACGAEVLSLEGPLPPRKFQEGCQACP